MSPDRRSRWIHEVVKTPALSNGTKLLLLWIGANDSIRGDFTFSIPRSQIADALGISRALVTQRFAEAEKARWLDRVQVGAPGITARYALLLPHGQDVVTKPMRGRVRDRRFAGGQDVVTTHGQDVITSKTSGRGYQAESESERAHGQDVLVANKDQRERSERVAVDFRTQPQNTKPADDSERQQQATPRDRRTLEVMANDIAMDRLKAVRL